MVNPYNRNIQEYKRNLANTIRNGQEARSKQYQSSSPKKNFTKKIVISKQDLIQGIVIFQTVGISAIITFIVFFMIQVIWADWFATNLPEITTGDQAMYWIQILLMLGIITGLGISLVTSFLFGEEKKIAGKKKSQRRHMIESIFASFLLAFLMLVMISFISVYVYDPYIFASLNVIELLAVSFEVMADFVIYVFPRPTEFWLISIGIYYAFLAVFFLIKVPRSRELDAKMAKKRAEQLRENILNGRRTECNHRKRIKKSRQARETQHRAEEIRSRISSTDIINPDRKRPASKNDVDGFLR